MLVPEAGLEQGVVQLELAHNIFISMQVRT